MPTRRDSSDCIVIGAGLIGLSTALHLRWRGLTVRVLERGRVGDGTSSRSSGWICAQLRTPNELLKLVLASLAYFPEFLARLDDRCDFVVCGSLVALDSEEQLEQRRMLDEDQRKVPSYAGARFLDARETHEIEPGLADTIVAGAHFAKDAQIDPRRLLQALVRASAKDGVVLHQGANVEAIERDGDAWRVTTTVGVFSAKTIVNAAGAWSPAVAELTGFELPILPVSGQLLVTEPHNGAVRGCVVSQPDPRFASRSACGVRPAADGRLWLGTTYRPGTFDTAITASDTAVIRDGFEQLFPGLRGFSVEEAWAGVRPVPADLLPVYGRLSAAENYLVAVPVAGLAESSIAGRLVADLVCEGKSAVRSEPFSPDRFADAE